MRIPALTRDKRLLCAGLAAAVGASALGIAARADISVSIQPYPICAGPGQEFTAYIYIDEEGSGFDGYETVVRFDPSVLEFVSVDEEDMLMHELCYNTWFWTEPRDSSIFISHVALCGGDTLTGPGALSSITFQAPGYETMTDITFDYIEFYKAGYAHPDSEVFVRDGLAFIAEECVGACCLADETCLTLIPEECEQLEGDFLGLLTSCDPNPCELAVCCLTGECYIVRQDECDDMSGRWHPEWEACDPNPCEYQGHEEGGLRGALLYEAIPNPFTHATRLGYHLESPAHLKIDLFDAVGRHIRSLHDAAVPSGAGTAVWNGREQSGRRAVPGAYFCRLSADGRVHLQRVVLLQ